MHDILTIDGVVFPVNILGLTQTSEFVDGEATGRTEAWDLFRDLKGIFYNYELSLGELQDPVLAVSLWNKLHEFVPFHTLKLPHNGGFLTFQAYVTGCSRPLKKRVNDINYWGGYSVKFIAKKPQITS